MTAQNRLLWFRRLARAGALLALVVVVMGAWVRLTAAGLGCPDWPGCYGHLHPAAAVAEAPAINALHPTHRFDYGKALREMVHRYAASVVGLICLGLLALSVVNRRYAPQPRTLPLLLVVVVGLRHVVPSRGVVMRMRLHARHESVQSGISAISAALTSAPSVM